MSPFSQWIADWLMRLRWPLFGLAVLATVVTGLGFFTGSIDLQYDRSIENMFSEDDPLLPPYRRLKERFAGNEIVLLVYDDPNLFEKDNSGVDKAREVTAELSEVAGVKDAFGVASIDTMLNDIDTERRKVLILAKKIGGITSEHDLATAYRELFVGYTHGADNRTVAIVCMLQPESIASATRRETIDAIRKIAERQPSGMIAGEPVMVVDGFQYVEEDGARLGWWTTILLGIVILLCFRSLRWLFIPLAVVWFTLLLTQSLLVFSGMQLSMVSSMLTAIVTVVGIAAVLHLVVRFREARRRGESQEVAMRQTLAILVAPIAWACLTDAVGFLALLWADVGPVADFGVMMAIGSSLVLVSIACIAPLLGVIGRFDADPKRAWGEAGLDTSLSWLVNASLRRPWIVLGTTIALFAVAIFGLTRQEVETDFTRNFRQGSPVVKSYNFIETNFGGAGVIDIMLPLERLDNDYLEKVTALEERLASIEIPADTPNEEPAKLTKIMSFVDADRPIGLLPETRLLSPELRLEKVADINPEMAASLIAPADSNNNRRVYRIMLRAKERQSSQQKQALIAAVQKETEAAFPEGEVTGFFVLLTNLIQSMIRDQWVTFAIAGLGIALMMTVAFRNPLYALMALLPNVLPILLVLGGMGLLGYRINMGAAMIAAVSIGLSVDSSIHYIISFQRARRAGGSIEEALQQTQQTVGRAAVFATLALMVGFSVLCVSNFIPTIYFGALVTLSMLGGLIGNLVLLPLLLRMTTRRDAVLAD